jgi:hypothetical protein
MIFVFSRESEPDQSSRYLTEAISKNYDPEWMNALNSCCIDQDPRCAEAVLFDFIHQFTGRTTVEFSGQLQVQYAVSSMTGHLKLWNHQYPPRCWGIGLFSTADSRQARRKKAIMFWKPE